MSETWGSVKSGAIVVAAVYAVVGLLVVGKHVMQERERQADDRGRS